MAMPLHALRACALSVATALACPAVGDHRPALVVPGRPAGPVIVEGCDAAGATMWGDWGLHRPGHAQVVVIGRPDGRSGALRRRAPARVAPPPFFPGDGIEPELGRHEADPEAGGPPRPAEPFEREWSTRSMQRPADRAPPPAAIAIEPRIRLHPRRPEAPYRHGPDPDADQ